MPSDPVTPPSTVTQIPCYLTPCSLSTLSILLEPMPPATALDPWPCPVSPEGAGTMNKLRQSLRRRKPAYVPEASRPHQWQADEDAVRKGTCSFPVRVSGWGHGRGAVSFQVLGAG